MSEPTPAAAGPPAVDHPAVAAALQEIADLDARPLAEHHERISSVHEVLHAALHPSAD